MTDSWKESLIGIDLDHMFREAAKAAPTEAEENKQRAEEKRAQELLQRNSFSIQVEPIHGGFQAYFIHPIVGKLIGRHKTPERAITELRLEGARQLEKQLSMDWDDARHAANAWLLLS